VDGSTGIITTVAGNFTAVTAGDGGPAASASLYFPSAVTLDLSGNLYLADSENHIRRIDASTGIIRTVAGTGTASFSGDGGLGTAAQLYFPTGLGVDNAGNLLIADTSNA